MGGAVAYAALPAPGGNKYDPKTMVDGEYGEPGAAKVIH